MRKLAVLCCFIFTVLIAGAAVAQEDPVVFYDSFVKVSANAKSLDELKPYLSQKNVVEMSNVPKEDEAFILEFLKETRNTMKRKSISSKVNGDTAILTVKAVNTADNSPIDGTITLVKENGSWKVDNEDFTSEAVVE